MLSTSCKYAIRATVYITSHTGDGSKCGIKEIAEEIEANEHTTAKILQLLVKENIIQSVKGPNGGFFIKQNAAPVYLIDVVKLVDGTSFFFQCGLGLKKCSSKKPCPIHNHYTAIREQLYDEFCTISIQQLSEDLTLGKAYLKR